MIQDALARLLDGRDLSRSEAREAMGEIMRGEATSAQIGGFLVALRLKGEPTPSKFVICATSFKIKYLAVSDSVLVWVQDRCSRSQPFRCAT